MPYRPLKDPIARHARPLIAMLEDKIRGEFGIEVGIGMEKEMWMDIPHAGLNNDFDEESAEFAQRMQRNAEEGNRRIGRKLGRSVKPVLDRFYEEASPRQFEFTTPPAAPLRAVHRMDGQCQLMGSMPSRRNGSSAVRRVSFKPTGRTFKDNNGLHVNFSLWKDGENLSHEMTTDISGHLVRYLQSDALLVAPTESAFKRLRNIEADKFGPDCECKPRGAAASPEKTRLEFRYPSSDARHDLSVLLVMSAIYQGLRQAEADGPGPGDLPQTWDSAWRRFQEKSRLMPDLADLAGNDMQLRAHAEALQEAILDAAAQDRLAQPSRMPPRRVSRGGLHRAG